jgi:hypothetical protein
VFAVDLPFKKRDIGTCLDDLLASRFLARSYPRRIQSSDELPPALERCVTNLSAEPVWRAHGDGERLLFAIGSAHLGDEQDAAPAIDVYFLDENAAVYCAGVWVHDRVHGWWLDAVLDLSYDCEHGWWIDTLMAKPTSVVPVPQLAATVVPQLAFRTPP